MKTIKPTLYIFISIFSIIVTISSCSFAREKDPKDKFENAKVVQKWASVDSFQTPESACYDAVSDIIFISNTANKQNVTNQALGNGFISKISKDGKIIKLKWITGINSPKGLGILGRKLYAADVNCVREIDIDNNKLINTYPAEGAEFLNDISVDPKTQTVYISDMTKNRIYTVKDGKISIWLETDSLKHPNGLFVENESMYIGTSQEGKTCILKVNLKTKQLTHYIDHTTGVDAVEPDGNGNIIITDWSGTMNLTNPNKPMHNLLNLLDKHINLADANYIRKLHLIVVPTFYYNRVLAYELIY